MAPGPVVTVSKALLWGRSGTVTVTCPWRPSTCRGPERCPLSSRVCWSISGVSLPAPSVSLRPPPLAVPRATQCGAWSLSYTLSPAPTLRSPQVIAKPVQNRTLDDPHPPRRHGVAWVIPTATASASGGGAVRGRVVERRQSVRMDRSLTSQEGRGHSRDRARRAVCPAGPWARVPGRGRAGEAAGGPGASGKRTPLPALSSPGRRAEPRPRAPHWLRLASLRKPLPVQAGDKIITARGPNASACPWGPSRSHHAQAGLPARCPRAPLALALLVLP